MDSKERNTDWFNNCGWGVFTHYLADIPDVSDAAKGMDTNEWNRRIDDFDVHGLASQLESVGAKYYYITIGQNSGYYCAPNETYDSITCIKPGKCSERDLISDIHDAIEPKGIKLLVYLPSGAPRNDNIAVKKLGWEWKKEGTPGKARRLAEFQKKWEAIIRDWSVRWRKKVCGWWIDGCYFADEMYNHPDPPNFESFASAMKEGNPESIVAFNPGVTVPIVSLTEHEDYTAGEVSDAFPVCSGRWVKSAQYHVLSYLGEHWGRGKLRFPDEFVIGYTKHVTSKGGVVTWDVPIDKDGHISETFLKQLAILGKYFCTTSYTVNSVNKVNSGYTVNSRFVGRSSLDGLSH